MAEQYTYNIDMANDNSSHTKILRSLETNMVVLEIGCATGYMTRHMKENLNCSVFAVEVDAVSAQKAKPYCEELYIDDIEAMQIDSIFSKGQFDAIILADVIEHLKMPDLVLKKLKPILKETGFLLVSVPNGAHGSLALELLDGKWDYRDQGLLDKDHIKFFDKKNLTAMFESAGYFCAQLDRVVIHPRDTEMKTPWERYPRDVTAYLEKVNPEYQTYQFVIKAHPMTKVGWYKGLESALENAEEQIRQLNEGMDTQKEDYEEKIKRIEDEKQEIHRGYQSHIDTLEKEKTDLHLGYKKEAERREMEVQTQIQEYKTEIQNLVKKLEKEALHREKETQELKDLTNQYEELTHHLKHEREQISELFNRVQVEKNDLETLYVNQKVELETIKNSVSWTFLTQYRRFVGFILPDQSRRLHWYQLCTRALLLLFREGPLKFFTYVHQRLRFVKDTPPYSPIDLNDSHPWRELHFDAFDDVKVSVVIPVLNQCHHTYRCLCSLLDHTTIPFEVIIVDNGSDDGTKLLLKTVKGIKVIENEGNNGFVKACNQGSEIALGEFILFLNNDTEVTNDWLEALLGPFEDDRVGVVGAKLIYPDGRLQEAGNIIWKDGSGWNYGREDDPELPQYCYLKEVDYCSAACLVIKKTIWNEVGGYDMRYAPAYYEDTDLCFAVRDRGYKVMYQPEARIIHYEGATAGTNVSEGFKKFQEINRNKFIEKWKDTLRRDHYAGPEELYLARDRGVNKRVLVVDHYAPAYDKDSGSVRMLGLMMLFKEIGYKVTFWPDNKAFHERYTHKLQEIGIEALYGNIDFTAYVKKYGRFLDLIFLSRPHVAMKYIDDAKLLSNAKIIYDTVDLHCLREQRRAELENNETCRLEAINCANEWEEKELYLAQKSDVTLVVSPVEKRILEEKNGLKGKIAVISNIHSPETCCADFSDRNDLMFIGGFVHPPNEDGIVWFVEDILPIISEQLPDICLYIVGSHPTKKVKALEAKNIVVTGYVEDVSPYFEKSRVFVSPLRYGAGIKGKIGQSMAYGLPVVTTHIGAEGMGLKDGLNVMIAEDEQTFADKVLQVYQNRELWNQLSENAGEIIKDHFSPKVMRHRLQNLLSKINFEN